jgi:hypothetical protein
MFQFSDWSAHGPSGHLLRLHKVVVGRAKPLRVRVQSVGIVVDPAFFDDLASFVGICEQVLV